MPKKKRMTKEQAYDALIHPLIAQIIAICKEHKIPALASFTLDRDDGLHCTTALLDESWEPSEMLIEASQPLLRKRSGVLMVTTTNARGEVTSRWKRSFEERQRVVSDSPAGGELNEQSDDWTKLWRSHYSVNHMATGNADQDSPGP